MVESEEGGDEAVGPFLTSDDGADMGHFGSEGGILGMSRLHVELAAFVSGFPTGAGAENE